VQYIKAYPLMAFVDTETAQMDWEMGKNVTELLSRKKSSRQVLLNTHFLRIDHSQNEQPFSQGANIKSLSCKALKVFRKLSVEYDKCLKTAN
jgi:ABC-type lipoprotein export system ATPase subunit